MYIVYHLNKYYPTKNHNIRSSTCDCMNTVYSGTCYGCNYNMFVDSFVIHNGIGVISSCDSMDIYHEDTRTWDHFKATSSQTNQ